MRLILLLAWVAVEVLLLMKLAEARGGWAVPLVLIAAAVGGSAVIRRHGFRALREVQAATARGELPTAALLQGLLGLIAGMLLILPGLLSDLLALLLLAPGLRRRLAASLDRRIAKARPDLRQPVVIEGEYRDTTRPPPGLPPAR
ncbi:MAG TPA: FxsA family protein [Solimonas sp.]|nr:FxsA family protein [Solimonas sp.]